MNESSDLFQILTTQHQEVDAMLSMLAQADVEQRRALLPVLERQLLSHAKAEEQTLYAALAKAGEDEKQEAKHAKREHEDIEDALEELLALDFDDEGWGDALEALEEAVQHHVEEEEHDVFATARETFDTERLDAIADQFQEHRRKELEARGGADDNYEYLTKGELLEEARASDVPGRSSMTKNELIASLRAER